MLNVCFPVLSAQGRDQDLYHREMTSLGIPAPGPGPGHA